MKAKTNLVIGEFVYESRHGEMFKVVYYHNAVTVAILFENGGSNVTTAKQIRIKEVKNKFRPNKHGVGFIGEGNYITGKGNAHNREYTLWTNMLTRCYSTTTLENNYTDVFVCEEWHNFQNFAKWCNSQKGFHLKDENDVFFHLDKDLLNRDCRIYSPETCCFIPRDINVFLTYKKSVRSRYLTGVGKTKAGKFLSKCRSGGVDNYLGVHSTEQEAYNAYKDFKKSVAKDYANKYEGILEDSVILALRSFEVELDKVEDDY